MRGFSRALQAGVRVLPLDAVDGRDVTGRKPGAAAMRGHEGYRALQDGANGAIQQQNIPVI